MFNDNTPTKGAERGTRYLKRHPTNRGYHLTLPEDARKIVESFQQKEYEERGVRLSRSAAVAALLRKARWL